MRKLALIGLSLMAAAPALALSPAVAGSPTAQADTADANTLVQLMSPRDLLIDMEVREFDKHFVPSLRSNTELKELDEKYPGLFEAMHKSSRELLADAMGRTADRIHSSLATLIETSFTPTDIVELANFYRSPIGQKTLQQMAASADASQVYRQAVEERDFKLTEEQIASQVHDNAKKAAQSFTPEDQTEMLLFMAKPSFGKLAKVQPEIRKIMADAFNAPDPDFDRRVEQAMSAAIEQHIASFEKPGGE